MEIMENREKLIRDNDDDEEEERIHVSVRVRPLNDKEISNNDVSDWECINDDTIVYNNVMDLLASENSMHPTAYTFDRVFGSHCSTREVYEHGAKDVAISAIRGINSTVFVYGQTSTGKTYTMTGITEYAIGDVYEYMEKVNFKCQRDFILKFSAMEIYNESVRDMLGSDRTPLKLVDDPEIQRWIYMHVWYRMGGTIVENLTEEILSDRNHAAELLSICKAERQIEETSLDETRSRSSHLIIRLTIESSSREFIGRNNPSTLVAVMNFVDLAGSERETRHLSSGTRLERGSHINRGLMTLETVIRKLSKGPNGRIPYGDSKLTRILKASLGGNSRTAIICTISPARSHVHQSRNTLAFASRAKKVTTKARVNILISDKALMRHLQEELARLERKVKNSGSDSGPTKYYQILREKDAQIEKLEKEIKDLILQRDIAQSQVKEFIQILGDDASSMTMTQVGSGHYPHLRVQKSPEFETRKQETSPLVDPSLDVDNTIFSDRHSISSWEDHVKVPFFEDNFENGYTSPRILLSSSSSSISDSYHVWTEIEKQSRRTSEDLCREVHCIETSESNNKEATESNCSPFEDNTNFPVVKLHIDEDKQEIELASPPPLVKDQESYPTDDNEVTRDIPSYKGRELASPIFKKKDDDFSTIQYLDIAVLENPSSTYHLDKDSFGLKSLNFMRSNSCRASITSSSSSPWFKMSEYGENTPAVGSQKESEDCGGKLRNLNTDENIERFPGKDCEHSQENAHGNEIDTPDTKFLTCESGNKNTNEMSEKAELSTEQEITIKTENEIAQKDNVARKKNVEDVGLDPIEDERKGLTSWPVEFRRLQREIIELWHACNVSLVHRTYFFLLFQGDPSDAIYLEVEMRRMKFLRDKFSRGDKTIVDGRTLTLSSSAKALRQERRMLSEQMSKKFTDQERDKLFIEWGIGLNTKLRRIQLAHRMWSKTDDINHITDSAFLVAKLVGLIEPGQAPNKEMFGLNFTTRCSTGICSFKRSLVSLL
ncbi:hypothetical protein OROHE_024314 [Orobanche hederae]